ncbi:MAG TPA: hypothetical protein VGF49_24105 [Candidatus Solibacter sp.]|jgi:hypothetical protein
MSTPALSQPELIEEMIAGIGAKKAPVRFGASKALQDLSCRSPQLLYPHFDFFAAMLGHSNQILKWNTMLTWPTSRPWIPKGSSI